MVENFLLSDGTAEHGHFVHGALEIPAHALLLAKGELGVRVAYGAAPRDTRKRLEYAIIIYFCALIGFPRRDDMDPLVKRYHGRSVSSMTGSVTYLEM